MPGEERGERCTNHTHVPAAGTCRSCLQGYCTDCLVYVFGERRTPYCLDCALATKTGPGRDPTRNGISPRSLGNAL